MDSKGDVQDLGAGQKDAGRLLVGAQANIRFWRTFCSTSLAYQALLFPRPRRPTNPPYGLPGNIHANARAVGGGSSMSLLRSAKEPPMTKSQTSKAENAPKLTKISKVVALLERKEGATLDDIVTATGWQAHSARAALTGLKKKGHTLEKSKRGDVTCYRITKAA